MGLRRSLRRALCSLMSCFLVLQSSGGLDLADSFDSHGHEYLCLYTVFRSIRCFSQRQKPATICIRFRKRPLVLQSWAKRQGVAGTCPYITKAGTAHRSSYGCRAVSIQKIQMLRTAGSAVATEADAYVIRGGSMCPCLILREANVPCLFLTSNSARFVMLYMHSNAEDKEPCMFNMFQGLGPWLNVLGLYVLSPGPGTLLQLLQYVAYAVPGKLHRRILMSLVFPVRDKGHQLRQVGCFGVR